MDFQLLETLGVSFNVETKEQFLKYIEAFKTYNSHTNLISKNDEEFLFEKHIFDSLALNLFIQKYSEPNKLMDIGTGGGFPSVPLAILYKNMGIFAVDSTTKKINFIKKIKDYLKLENLNPIVSRIENLSSQMKESFDVVTTRALGALPLVLEYAVPYLKVGGYFVAYKSLDSENELQQAQNAMKVLKVELVDIIDYKLPLKENFVRRLLVFKKVGKTPSIYPRAYNVMKKAPL